ncbi:MAG: hypothetical protein ACRDQT_06090 [Gaiellaceae bacterium]
MRKLILLVCAIAAVVALALPAGVSGQTSGVLSVDDGRGVVILDLRGVVLGRLTTGTLRVTDHTPRDRFEEIVNGRFVQEERLGPRTTLYRGQGLRFRMVGGRYRIAARGTGITVSAIGRGLVQLDGEPRVPGEPAGLYSINDGTDCSLEPTLCTPLPELRESFVLGGVEESPQPRQS